MNKRIVIIGGGVIGLSCAYRLADESDVTVLEGGRCGSGATGASTGILWPPSPLKSSQFHTIHRQSLRQFPEFIRQLESDSGHKVNYAQCGGMEIISSKAQGESAQREVERVGRAEGVDVGKKSLSLVASDKLVKIEPKIRPTQFGAIYAPRCAAVSANDMVTALAAACARKGVIIREQCAVDRLTIEDGAVTAVQTAGESVPADAVLVAAGCGTPEIDPLLGRFAVIDPVKGQAITLATAERLIDMVIHWKRLFLYQGDDHIITVGSTTELSAGYDLRCTATAAEELQTKAAELLPELASAERLNHWAGLRPASFDRKPYLGAMPGVSGLFVAAGHYKVGLALAPITAEIITSIIYGEPPTFDVSDLQPREITEKGKKSWARLRNTIPSH